MFNDSWMSNCGRGIVRCTHSASTMSLFSSSFEILNFGGYGKHPKWLILKQRDEYTNDDSLVMTHNQLVIEFTVYREYSIVEMMPLRHQ